MKNGGGRLKENIPFSFYILIVCILIVVPVLFFASFSDYNILRDNFNKNYEQLQTNTEDSIIESIKIVNTGLEIYDETFNDRMKSAFIPFIEEYKKSGGDPEKLDLNALKEKLGPDYDLYLIDKDHVVRYSTKELDLGLDFSPNKEFSEHLDKILSSGEYKGDRIVRSVRDTSAVSKYAYYPSPDGEYILELSYDIKDYKNIRDLIQYKNVADSMMQMNPYLLSVKIYDIHGLTIHEPDTADKDTRELIVNNVINKKSDYLSENNRDNTVTRYRYVDLYNPDVGMDMSVAIAFNYSNAAIEGELNKILFSSVIYFFITVIFLMIVFYLATDIVTRPIKHLADDVDEIAKGNLDYKIRAHGGKEFLKLRRSISNMVQRLKITIDDLRESENTIKKYNEKLENIIEKRTKELNEANNQANFYIDLMTHDINNANMAALGYAQLIDDSSDEKTKELSKKLISSIRHSTDIIANVSLIRRIQSENVHLKPVSLDKTIKKEISHFPELKIQYTDSGYNVLADELLGEVFSNIIGNSKKYAGDDCRIEITAEEKDDEVRICIDDNGPGIADCAKDNVFGRLFRENKISKAKGKGMGLYIVKSLVESYGGSISISDTPENMNKKGLRVIIILKKA